MDEDVAIAPDQASAPREVPPKRTVFGLSIHAAILISILVAALLAESVLVFRGGGNDRARDDVLEVSRRFAALLTTYNATTIEAQRGRVLALATGKFRDEYQQLTGSSFVTTLRERQAESRGTVTRIAVTEVRDDSATVLALVQVTTTNKDAKTPRVDTNLLELSLVETSSGWKIDAVTILGTLT